jgi:hypothetical protein
LLKIIYINMATINNIEIDGINYELGGLSSIPVVN